MGLEMKWEVMQTLCRDPGDSVRPMRTAADASHWQTCSKFAEGVLGIPSSFFQLEESPGVVHHVLLVLRINRIHLSVFTARIEQGTQEKLGKPKNIRQNSQLESYDFKRTAFKIFLKLLVNMNYIRPEEIWGWGHSSVTECLLRIHKTQEKNIGPSLVAHAFNPST